MAAPPASALKRVPSVSASAGSEGAAAGGGAGAGAAAGAAASPSSAGGTPKRVTFKLPPPPSSAALEAAGRLLHGSPASSSGGGGAGLGSPAAAARRPSRLSEPAGGQLPAAFDWQAGCSPQPEQWRELAALTHLPGVDSPQPRLRPLAVPGLGACRRWPSNDALVASDEEIAERVGMEDTPLGRAPAAPAPARSSGGGDGPAGSPAPGNTGSSAPASLAEAIWELLPAAAGSVATPRAASACTVTAADGLGAAQPAAPATDGPEPPASPPRGLAARLGCLLRCLLAAAGASGSSVPQLTVAHNLPLSRSPSQDSLYATPKGSSGDLFADACPEPGEPLPPPHPLLPSA